VHMRFRLMFTPVLGCTLLLMVGNLKLVSAQTLVGAYVADPASQTDPSFTELADMSSFEGKPLAINQVYEDWCPTNLTYIFQMASWTWAKNMAPMVTWEPQNLNCGSGEPKDPDTEIANGQFDTYITNFVNDAKTFLEGPDGVYGTADDRRLYIRFAHEANGNSYEWCPSTPGSTDTAAEYVAMWQHVVTMARNAGLDSDHVQFIWNVNNSDAGTVTAEELFPGNSYANWVSVDGYNWGAIYNNWQTASQVFSPMVTRLETLSDLPIGIPEWGTTAYTSSGYSVSSKAVWISNLLTSYLPANPQIRMVLSFDIDYSGGDEDWAIFGGTDGDTTYDGYDTYSEYASGIGNSIYIGATTSNPRLLTSAQFAGEESGGGATNPVSTTWYNVINQTSGLCLDAKASGKTSGTILEQNTCGIQQGYQEWQFNAAATGGYDAVFNGNAPTLVWTDINGGAGNANDIDIETYASGSAKEEWKPVLLSNGLYNFVNLTSGMCLDNTGSMSSGVQMTQWSCTSGDTNKEWQLIQQ